MHGGPPPLYVYASLILLPVRIGGCNVYARTHLHVIHVIRNCGVANASNAAKAAKAKAANEKERDPILIPLESWNLPEVFARIPFRRLLRLRRLIMQADWVAVSASHPIGMPQLPHAYTLHQFAQGGGAYSDLGPLTSTTLHGSRIAPCVYVAPIRAGRRSLQRPGTSNLYNHAWYAMP